VDDIKDKISKVEFTKVEFKLKKKEIIVVLVWTLLLTMVMIKAHYLLYLRNPRFFYFDIAYSRYQPPSLEIVDMLLLLVMSVVVGALLYDVKSLLFSYIASIGIAFIVAVTYVTLFIWFILDYGKNLSVIPFGWEWAIYMGFLNMLWVVFPYVMGISVIGIMIGYVLRTWLD